jgi:hypothetical protein
LRKIPTIFERDWEGDRSLVLDKPNPEADWVFAGEGVATRKYDGMCCYFDGTTWFKRREMKPGQTAPPGWTPLALDEVTGKEVGWVPIADGPEDKYLREAVADYTEKMTGHPEAATPRTCEFLGPKAQGNIENFGGHIMLPHAWATNLDAEDNVPRDFNGLRDWLTIHNEMEGIVWHHPDGRMAKIKLRDFGLKRRAKVPQ